MKNWERYGVTAEQVRRFKLAEQEVKDAEEDIENTFMANYGVKKGDTVRNKSTGLHYKVEAVRYSIRGDYIFFVCYRLWTTGVKKGQRASSQSVIGPHDLEVVPNPTK